MARTAKKEKALTLEEKLAQALVPDVEQPYRIPKNWCWVRLDDLTSITAGGTPARNNKKFWEGGHIPWVKISDLSGKNLETTEEKITQLGLENSSAKTFKKGTILYTIFATIGEVAVLNIDAATNQAIAGITCKETQSIDYMYYVLLVLKDLLVSKSKGVAQVNINQTILKETPIPLAPLAEQQRIVELIENMFAKLDEAKAKAQAVIDGYEDRRAAILHKAFTGELTAEWRKKSGRADKDWVDTPLDEVCRSIFDGDHMPPPKSETGIPFLVISNVNTGHLSFEDTRFVPQEYYDSLSTSRKPEMGDVLYTLVGSYGIPVVVDDNRPFCFQRHMALLKPSKVNSYFLWYQLQSQEFYNKASAIATGTAQLTVPIKGLRKLSIRIPSDLEQSEIVRLLNELIEKEQQAKEAAEQVIDQIDSMKKSILARAFRGELGTNDPTDESAVELLKRVL
jgi:type I restriction enzyme S subunit